MPAQVLVRPPNRPSSSARVVTSMFAGNARRSRRDPVPRQYRHVINWGNTSPIHTTSAVVYNSPAAVSRAVNKLLSFEKLKEAGVIVPEFSSTLVSVPRHTKWLARTQLSASGGRGIVIMRHGDTVVRAPLYVKYIKKRREFRVHVVKGEAIFVQEKRRRNGADQDRDEALIRNYDNGWVFTLTNESNVPVSLKDEAVKAVSEMGLDFGAVDCIIGLEDNLPYVLEINTAPGIESPSLKEAYTVAFRRMCGSR